MDISIAMIVERAIQGIVTSVAGESAKPLGQPIREIFLGFIGKDQVSLRRAAEDKALKIALDKTLKQFANDRQQAENILNLLDDEEHASVRPKFLDKATEFFLLGKKPEIQSLTDLCLKEFQLDKNAQVYKYGKKIPEKTTVNDVILEFINNLTLALSQQEVYQKLITQLNASKEARAKVEEYFCEQRQHAQDEINYRKQVAEAHRILRFAGFPELRERSIQNKDKHIEIKDIFVRLRAEQEIKDAKYRKDILSEEEKPTSKIDETTAEFRGLQKQKEVMLDEALKEIDCAVILGDPGAGKTTLLEYWTVICAEQQAEKELGITAANGTPILPIFVRLRDFATELAKRPQDYNLIDYFCTRCHKLELTISRRFFEEALEEKRCLVCLDGLDEVGSDRIKIRDAVKALVTRYPGNRYIVTSRIVGYEEAPLDHNDFVHHTILKLTIDDIREFVNKWYKLREPDLQERNKQINHLIATIEREKRIQNLAENPLLLTIITLVHRIEAELPNERVKLYEKCITALVENWEKVKDLSIEEKQSRFYNYRQRLLERLAYELHTKAEEPGKLQTVKEGNLEELLTSFLNNPNDLGLINNYETARKEAKDFVRFIQERTGLLTEIGDGVFSFPHLTFQEYLTACDIKKRRIRYGIDGIWTEIEKHLHKPHWREVILLLLGSLNNYDDFPTELLQKILDQGKKDQFEAVLHRHSYLVATALVDRVEVTTQMCGQIADELLEIASKAPSWERDDVTLDIIFAALLELKRDSEISKKVLKLAQNPDVDADVRLRSAEILVESELKQEAVEVLLQLVAQNSDSDVSFYVRITAAEKLVELKHEQEAVKGLLQLAQNPNAGPYYLPLTVEKLVELKHEQQAVEVLLQLAKNPNVDVYDLLRAVEKLVELKHEQQAIEVLLQLAQNPNVDVYNLPDVIEKLVELKQEQQAVEVLLQLGQNPNVNGYNLRRAVEKLVELKHEQQAIEVLLQLAQNSDVNASVWQSTVEKLVELKHEQQAIEVLRQLAQNSDVNASVRLRAAEKLLELKQHEQQAIEVLRQLAQNSDVNADVRRSAAEKLLELKQHEQQAIEVLRQLAQNSDVDAYVRRSAAEKLLELKQHEQQAIEVLLQIVNNPNVDGYTWERAVKKLVELKQHEQQAIEVLLQIVNNPNVDGYTWERAVKKLVELKPEQETPELLLQLAQNPNVDGYTWERAVEKLVELKPEQETLELLLQLAQNPNVDGYTWERAVEKLVELKPEQETLELLLQLAQNPNVDGYTWERAVEKLVELKPEQETLELLLQLAQNSNVRDTIRSSAYSLLKTFVDT
ncbi:putative signal transduction protein containing Nacht domain [Anabaenopsis circularis NIES-21]|uniref:Putative signal transduction protein containing Nacht domain n=1 Tax=Anabaenopsis circularis NIES-21 TaxID=1085406 RepID=A0A1Z4GKC8_9CYAN|nr:putative signal transduction protein containing Nacht domain [Anabaenopsis circularis NIES-21]